MFKRAFYEKRKGFIKCSVILCMAIFLMSCGVKQDSANKESETGAEENVDVETETVFEDNTEDKASPEEVDTEDKANPEGEANTENKADIENVVDTEGKAETETEHKQESELQAGRESTDKNNKKSVGDFLLTALKPIGNTMYVWGGGWNEEDTGAGIEAVTLGVSSRWAEFAAMQNASYDYQTTRYQIHDGLDCSGYVGWCIYNIMETENGKEGYVMKASQMAENFAQRGWGNFARVEEVTDYKAGDIMSMDSGHVWIVVGACEDGSVVLMHSRSPGVRIAGTALPDGSKSEAVYLAEKYMSTYYPQWYNRYPDCKANASYLTTSTAMRWNGETLSDEEGLTEMSAEEVLKWMFVNMSKV